jgi:hypothetical protein
MFDFTEDKKPCIAYTECIKHTDEVDIANGQISLRLAMLYITYMCGSVDTGDEPNWRIPEKIVGDLYTEWVEPPKQGKGKKSKGGPKMQNTSQTEAQAQAEAEDEEEPPSFVRDAGQRLPGSPMRQEPFKTYQPRNRGPSPSTPTPAATSRPSRATRKK